ncbi:MAG: M48 family metalloprotease [Candidatus Eremiobacteraeota bacterium]|nr:M48 family metalloprotease [Candidatus Eremiobacteraeota bacterium]
MKHRLPALLLTCAFVFGCALPAAAYTAEQQQELQIGQQEYQQLQQQGKIVTQSPYYAKLNPIAKRIAAVADRKYFTPFRFILVNDSQPNAFAVPGGNVYVTTAMMTYAKNQEELANVLCHETSHDIHHDVMNLQPRMQTIGLIGGILSMLTHNSGLAQAAINIGATAEAGKFSRQVETNADHTGAYMCAAASYNPWGSVWLFKRFLSSGGSGTFEALSDHPRDDHRISDLETLYRSDPATFGRFNSNEAYAHPL